MISLKYGIFPIILLHLLTWNSKMKQALVVFIDRAIFQLKEP